MVFTILGHPEGYPSVTASLGAGCQLGTFNNRPVFVAVVPSVDDQFGCVFDKIVSTLVHPSLAVFLGRETFPPKVDGYSYNVYAIEAFGCSLLDVDFSTLSFEDAISVVQQIMSGVRFMHNEGFRPVNLNCPSCYMIKKVAGSVIVKFQTWFCFSVVDEDNTYVQRSMEDLGKLFAFIFYKRQLDVGTAADLELMRCVPEYVYDGVLGRRHVERAYTCEVRHLIRSASDPINIVPHWLLLNHHSGWETFKRFCFVRDAWEFLTPLPEDHPLVVEINHLPDFYAVVGGRTWQSIHWTVRADLGAPDLLDLQRADNDYPYRNPLGRGRRYSLVTIRGSPLDFLRCFRNLAVHCMTCPSYHRLNGLRIYEMYDADVPKGIDKMFSIRMPFFFGAVYDAFVKFRYDARNTYEGRRMDECMDWYLNGSYLPSER